MALPARILLMAALSMQCCWKYLPTLASAHSLPIISRLFDMSEQLAEKISRKQQILQALAHMLEIHPGELITTAGLAKEVGVSEAALYRHFPSKYKMYEGLIEFIEDAVFSRVSRILEEDLSATARC